MQLQQILDIDEGFNTLTHKEQVKRIAYAYYIQTENTSFNPIDLSKLFKVNNLVTPNISRELSSISKDKPCEIFKTKSGYVLERGFIKLMDNQFNNKYSKEVVTHFQTLLKTLQQQKQKEYLQEALACYNLKLYRPAIIMTWIVALDVLFDYVIDHHLSIFNVELAKANKKYTIQKKADFEDLKESQFIEILRASSIITKEQKKILDEKLDIRNSAAHPNSTSFKEAKTTTFIEELFNDVISTFVI